MHGAPPKRGTERSPEAAPHHGEHRRGARLRPLALLVGLLTGAAHCADNSKPPRTGPRARVLGTATGKGTSTGPRFFGVELTLINDEPTGAWYIVSSDERRLADEHQMLELVRNRPRRPDDKFESKRLALATDRDDEPHEALAVHLSNDGVRVDGDTASGDTVSHVYAWAVYLPARTHLIVTPPALPGPLDGPGKLSVWRSPAIPLPDGHDLAEHLERWDTHPIPDPPSMPIHVSERWSLTLQPRADSR